MRPDELTALVRSPRVLDGVQAAFRDRGLAPPADASVGYIRYKPDVGCLLGLRDASAADDRPIGYLKLFFEGGAETCFEKYESWTDEGWAALRPELSAVFFAFPTDRNVRGLRFVVDPNRLKHVLHDSATGLAPEKERVRGSRSRVRILKYKPERRCIVRADLATKDSAGRDGARTIVAQANGDDSGRRVHRVMEHLEACAARSGGLGIAPTLGYDAVRQILLQHWVEGEPLGELLDDAKAVQACVLAACSLRAVHGVPELSGLPANGADVLAERASRILQDLGRLGGAHLSPVTADLDGRLGRAVRRCRERPGALLHGDFYYHQVIVGSEGCRLIDWDEACFGDPLVDIGNFLAHLHLREIDGRLEAPVAETLRDTFVRAYFPSGRVPADLDLFTSLQLVLLSMTPFRNLRNGWADAARTILDRSRDLLRLGTEVRA